MKQVSVILINAAISAYNAWQNNRNSRELQDKQQGFTQAAANHHEDLMWDLLRESRKISLDIENELHKQRLKDLAGDFDKLLEKTAKQISINSWPLDVLPIVMKNQSLGNLIVKNNDKVKIAVHCILAPSNCNTFNQVVLPVINRKLEDYFNQYWSTTSSHPVLFYGDAWNSKCCPTGTEIEQLKSHLENLPTLIIYPFFKDGNESGLVFKLEIWGMGYTLKNDIVPTEFSYKSDTYNKKTDFVTNTDVREITIEEFIPFLQCVISYFVDQYYWNGYGIAPHLLQYLNSDVISTDGQRYLIEQYSTIYQDLTKNYLDDNNNVRFHPDNCLKLCATIEEPSDSINMVIREYCSYYGKKFFNDPSDFVRNNTFRREEFSMLDSLIPFIKDKKIIENKKSEYWDSYHKIAPRFDFKKKPHLTYLEILKFALDNRGSFNEADSFEILFLEQDYSVLFFFTRKGHVEHNDKIGVTVVFTPILYVPQVFLHEEHVVIGLSEIEYIFNETEKIMNALDIKALLNEGDLSSSDNNYAFVNKFISQRAEFMAEMEKKYQQNKDDDMLVKVKESLDSALESVSGSMDEAKEKLTPVFEDMKGKFESVSGSVSETVSETMDKANEKITPVIEDIKGKFSSFLKKKNK